MSSKEIFPGPEKAPADHGIRPCDMRPDWNEGVLSRLDFNSYAEETARQTISRLWSMHWQKICAAIFGLVAWIGTMCIWEGWLFPV